MQDKKLSSLLCIIGGTALALFPFSAIRWLIMALGVLVLIYGISRLNAHSPGNQTFSIVTVVIGLFLIISPQFILGLLPKLLGLLILIYGILEIQKVVQKKRLGHSRWVIDAIIAAAITILGISLFTNPFGFIGLLMKIAGILIIYEGISFFLRQNKNA